ncbi:hypothetical protein FRB97_004373 [Tulasnella sp. 331]|nr:hypothetical protein FRB97_004373 [Tulasnella sp. 331]
MSAPPKYPFRPHVRLTNLQGQGKLKFTESESSTGPEHQLVWKVIVTITSLDPDFKDKFPVPLSTYSFEGIGSKVGKAQNNASYLALEAMDQLWDNPPKTT